MAGSQDDHTRPFTTRPRLRRGDARESDMIKLKDVYPLYLANEAKQPNTDLEVTDKYTGKVAFRTALADAGTIDAGIAAAVEAAEPMARMASYERQAVLQHCVDRFKERFDEMAYALCVEAGRSEEHTSELQSLMRSSYAGFCLKKKNSKRLNG